MLRTWTTPFWALIGALLAVCEFGPLSQWMNSYWGGAASASAGCLVFGSLPRLRNTGRSRYAAILGAGLGLQVLTRPFESILLAASVLLYFTPALATRNEWRGLARAAFIAALAAAPAFAITLLHDHAVTGSWTTLPYILSRYQYGVPTTFTVQPNPVPHRKLTHEQEIDYEAHRLVHGEGTDTVRGYFSRLAYRLRFYRFFFFAPLYLVLPLFLASLREFRFVWVLLSILIFGMGSNFYPYFHPHYIAAATCLFLLMSVTSLQRLSRIKVCGSPAGREAARIILFLCAGQFLFWYGIHLSGSQQLLEAAGPYETWDYINYGDPEGRIAVGNRLRQMPGKQLVFIQYWPRHLFEEWIHNAADIDAARVVFADDLGSAENQQLRRYYPDRTAWILEPDARPPRLTPYPSEPAEESAKPVPSPAPQPHRIDPKLFETVH
jgi:hypothetical protein